MLDYSKFNVLHIRNYFFLLLLAVGIGVQRIQ